MDHLTTELFDSLYRESYEQLFYHAYGFTEDAEACRDIISDVFERLWTNRHRIAPDTARLQAPTLIRPNQQTYLNADGTLTTSDTDTYQYTEWKNGIFYFDDITLREILCEMGRWYNINVEVKNKQALQTKLHFVADRNADIAEAIKNLNALGHFNIIKEEGTIVVK